MKLKTISKLKLILTIISFGLPFGLYAQYTQTIKGSVRDQASHASLPGVNVILLSTDPLLGTISDADGKFEIKNVPVGRYDVQISYVGYETVVIPSVLLTSGKEVIINAELNEQVTMLDEITVRAREKDEPINSMATLSARTFTIEETGRYAGGLDDPGRLVSTFAGVSDGNLQSNGIVVRGNAPFGTGYRIEGLPVDNPNHFAGEDFLGGGFVSILSKNVLRSSDFLTGAFPAQYGNALSAVFDMNLKTGNAENREHTFQAGVLGLDLASEGPFMKGKDASYIFNYRYSTFGLVQSLLPDETGLPVYQDLSFKFRFPTKMGEFTLWGAGGIGSYKSGKESEWDSEIIDDVQSTGVLGLKHKLLLGETAYVTTSVGVNASTKSNRLQEMWTDSSYYWNQKMDELGGRYMFSSSFNKKLSSRWRLRMGIEAQSFFYDFENYQSPSIPDPMERLVHHDGSSILWQGYFQSKYHLLQNLILNAGLHYQYLELNDANSLEPRAGIQWLINQKNKISFAYGRHSQMQLFNVYLVGQEDALENALPNIDLGFTKADHYILAYDWLINKNVRLKIETYYQSLFDVPVEENTAFSIINLADANTFDKTLVNEGVGHNMGVDVTFERFFANNYYYMLTASVFDSRFEGGDGVERNTMYNKRFVANILAGKEFVTKRQNVFSINGRLYINRGNWISPVDYEDLSNESAFFKKQQPTNYRFDLSTSYTRNKERYSSVWSVQVLNVLGSECPMSPTEDLISNEFYYEYESVVLPSISWKIQF